LKTKSNQLAEVKALIIFTYTMQILILREAQEQSQPP
jgi:hypothetical protein